MECSIIEWYRIDGLIAEKQLLKGSSPQGFEPEEALSRLYDSFNRVSRVSRVRGVSRVERVIYHGVESSAEPNASEDDDWEFAS
jgi:hypothetical protein